MFALLKKCIFLLKLFVYRENKKYTGKSEKNLKKKACHVE